MKLNGKYSVALIALAAVGLLAIWSCWDEFATPEIAPFQRTDGWARWLKSVPKEASFQYTESGEQIAIENQPGIFLRV